jgi:hypothetical protein
MLASRSKIMETQIKKEYSTDSKVAEQAPAELNYQAQKMGKQVSDFLAELPEKINKFYQEYKLPILSFALLVATIISLKIVLGIVGAVNGIPLVKPFFQLIGMCYTFWFISRYLLKNSTRKELAAELDVAKKQVVGKTALESSI